MFNRPVYCSILIGRNTEQDHLRRFIEQTKTGNNKIILISGEAGIGKSRIAKEVTEWSLSQGFRVLQGNCFQTDVDAPYAPFIDLLRTIWTAQSGDKSTNELLQSTSGKELAQFFPEFYLASEQAPVLSALDPDQEKRRLFSVLTNFFFNMAKQQPLLIVIEDIHWSDDSSREFLLYLVRQSRDQPLGVIVTYRSDEVTPALRSWLSQMDRERMAQEVSLIHLMQQDVRLMVESILGLEHPLDAEFINAIYGHTDGNPFFIEEVLKTLLPAGLDNSDHATQELFDEMHVPRSVQDVVQQRLQQISQEAKQAVVLAAVAGRRFDFTLLQSLLVCDESQLLQWIKELINAQLVVEETSERFAFRHALTRQAIYTSLLARERKMLHRLIAQTSETIYEKSIVAHIGDIAYHFYEAGVWIKALSYSRRAGERALALFTPQAAVEQLNRALYSASQLASPADSSLHRVRGRAYELLGNFESARLDYFTSLEIATNNGDKKSIWNTLVALGFHFSAYDYAKAGFYFQEALLVATALNHATLEAHSLNRIGNWLVNIGEPDKGLANHHKALDIFTTNNDRYGMAETYDHLGMASGQSGNIVNAVKFYGQAVHFFRELNNLVGLTTSLASRASYQTLAWNETVYAVVEPEVQVIQALGEALRLSQQMGAPSSEAFVEWITALAYSSNGKFGQGLFHAHRSLQIALDIGHQQWLTATRFTLGQIYTWMLLPDRAIPELKAGLSLAQEIGSAWWIGSLSYGLASAYFLKKEWFNAETALLTVMAFDQHPSNLSERRIRYGWGQLALARGQTETAIQIVDELIESVPSTDELQSIPRLLKLKGDAFSQMNDYGQALSMFDLAAAAAQQREDYSLLWQILCDRGWVLRKLNQYSEAQSAFTRAYDIVTRHATSIDDARITQQFLEAVHYRFPKDISTTSQKVDPYKYGGLTRREREIAVQISLHKSNREVAEFLGIGERTVETHVSNILSKLDLVSRREIVQWVASNRLPELS